MRFPAINPDKLSPDKVINNLVLITIQRFPWITREIVVSLEGGPYIKKIQLAICGGERGN